MTYIKITSNSPKVSAYFQRVARDLPNVLDAATQQTAIEAQQMFQSTTGTWKHQPTFAINKEATGRWGVGTDDPIYHFVDAGTRPHVIEARRVPYLRFTVGGSAKTKPRNITSFAGSRGDQWVSKKRVNHPGITAREFSRTIHSRVMEGAANRLRAALRQAIAGPGVGL